MSDALRLDISLSRSDLRARARVRKKAPDRAELNRMFPGCERIETNPRTGKQEWVIDVRTHERNGDMTRAGKKLDSAMRPYMAARTEQGRSMTSLLPKPVALKDGNGVRRLVQPHLADETARKHGWGSGERLGGNRVERGGGGMLWRLIHGHWEPLGVTCLSTPHIGHSVKPRGLQYDPDGHPWRFVDARWRRVG